MTAAASRGHERTQTKLSLPHTRTHSHSEITAVLSCYAAVTPSSQITHTYAHTQECETGTVTPDLAGSEGHRGFVTKLPSNKRTVHTTANVISCVPLYEQIRVQS